MTAQEKLAETIAEEALAARKIYRIECPRCYGQGSVGRDSYTLETFKCRECGGEGKIWVKYLKPKSTA